MDKLLALKMFVETVDAKGFSSAARNLSVATSSVTRMVDSLESELGTVLLNRSTRQITVSDAGMAYYMSARKILDSVLDADEQIKDSQDEASGPLRVTVPTTFGSFVIAPHIGRFLHQYPKLDLDLQLSDDITDLFTQRIDLSIRLGSAAPTEELISRPLGQFRRLVVASPEYIKQYGLPQQPADLLYHQCLRFSSQLVWTFLSEDEEQRIPIKGKLKTNNVEVIREVVLSGHGIALLPDWLIQQDINSGQMISLLTSYQVNPNSSSAAISALYLPNHRGSKRVNAFIDFIREIVT
ncbi:MULTISPECIES: LysR family transcriptional regulator [Shewanella]|uniref:LysR family transcriptional regulator n=1 Tax=Shewanella TaxID=22 RepID=UPI000C4FED9B|nr:MULTISPECIES: LysR family transcriptional regulator [Shewanella]NCQ44971.1 LysR family transcriptional regulator [Shewanella frigidimarina]NCO71227.1 LysR family transcriptional regulator [Shewanella vesiculosa]NCP37487.1 LysR family transcriptional regulator [Shewanella vesiculosa]NCP70788.1 LysR family transcriptional regulator [Shewanella vesiculosa]NCP74847.1 LysR family transcriptional regulator [Shewanella vesiculosa]